MSDYQKSHKDQACVFCGSQDETIVGHHVRIKGLCGTGMKPHDVFAMPVCHIDHEHCHSGFHNMKRQKEKLLKYWMERLIQKHGEKRAWELVGLDIYLSAAG